MTAERLEFQIVGRLEVLASGQPVALGGAKERSLLGLFLIRPNQVVPLDTLIDELWDGRPPDHAATATRVYVSHLRKVLGKDVILTRVPGYELRVDPDCLDSARFEHLVSVAQERLVAGEHQAAALGFRDALGLWRGPVLGDIAALGAARPEIVRLEELRLGAIEGRIEADLGCGRHAQVVGELEALCSQHPLRERLWAQRITALYRCGRQADALRAYQDLRTLLGEELGISPSPELVALEQAVLDQAPDLELPPPRLVVHDGAGHKQASGPFPLPPAIAAGTITFVGRHGELSQLRRAVERAESGHRQMVMVAGEPGIGKTSLVTEAARAAHGDKAVVLFGHCDEEPLVPFQPFVEALAHFVAASRPDDLDLALGPHAADIALLVPQLRQRLPELPDPLVAGADTQRYRLFEAVLSLFAAMARRAPVVLVLDDLHWADRPTLQLLVHVIRRTPEVRLLVLGTYRDTDLVRTHPMAEALVELRRADVLERITLKGLASDEVVAMVAGDNEPEPADMALGQELWAQTEGSPLFVREVIRHLAETEAIVRTEDGRWRAKRRIDRLGLPEGVREVIGRRLTRLSPDTNAVLRTGSVMGRVFRAEVVAAVQAVDLDKVLDSLDEAAAAGVVTEAAGSGGHYSFTHVLVRETLYAELSAVRRVRLHQRVGEAVESLHAERLDSHLSELAYHFSQAAVAGQGAKAIDYARRAGEQAMTGLAYEESVRYLAMALEVAEDTDAEDTERCELLLAMGAAQWRAKDHNVARATFDQAAGLARAAGDGQRFARAALGYAGNEVRWGWVEPGRSDDHVVTLLQEALVLFGPGDSALGARVLGALAAELHFAVEADGQPERHSTKALAMARRVGDPVTLSYVLSARNLATLAPGTAEERLENAEEALVLAEQVGDPVLAAFAHFHRTNALIELDDIAGARASARAAEELAQRIQDPTSLELIIHTQGLLSQLEGRFGESERLHLEAFRIGQEARTPVNFPAIVCALMSLRRMQGRLQELIGGLEAGLAAYDKYQFGPAGLAPMMSALHAELGNSTEARRYLDRVDILDTIPGVFRLWFQCSLAVACCHLGDKGRATELYRQLGPYAKHNATVGGLTYVGSVSEFLGMLAATIGRFDDAGTHFEDALASYRRNGWGPLLAHAQIEYAAALVGEGSPEGRARAVSLAEEGLGSARRLGMGTTRTRALQLLSELSEDSPVVPLLRPKTRVTRRDRARSKVSATGRRAVARLTHSASDEELVRRFGSPLVQRALFASLARAFQPAMAFGFEGEVAFELRAGGHDSGAMASEWWTVEVAGKKATARRGQSVAPAATLRLDLADFVRMAAGSPPMAAILEGRVQIEGDVTLLLRFGDMFGAVEPFEVLEAVG